MPSWPPLLEGHYIFSCIFFTTLQFNQFLELEWIKPKGRKRSPGRPLTWGTTDKFLDIFGLEDISNLPGMSDLKAAGLVGSRPIISDDLSNVVEKDIEKDLES